MVGSVIHELAIPSGRVLFAWHSLDHVGLDESHQSIGPQFDYFHANSVDMDGQGNLLISARNTWGVYKVSRKTGEVMWRLGGKKSDFEMGPGTVFAWQHDARFHEHGRLISLFDDGADPKVEPQSRALDAHARHQADARPPDAQVHAPACAPRDAHGQRAAAPERQHARRLGERAVLHRVRAERRRAVRRAAAERAGRRTVPSASPGSASRRLPPKLVTRPARPAGSAMRAGTARPRWPRGSSSPGAAPARCRRP